MTTDSLATDTALLLQFMFRLGQAYLACHEQTPQVELLLRRTAAAYGMPGSRIMALPTAIFIALHDGVEERVTLAEGPSQTLRLEAILGKTAIRTGRHRRGPHDPDDRRGDGAHAGAHEPRRRRGARGDRGRDEAAQPPAGSPGGADAGDRGNAGIGTRLLRGAACPSIRCTCSCRRW